MSLIVVIEDEPTDFSAIARVLGREHEIIHWASGREALQAYDVLPAGPPRVIIVDLGLPDIHGAEVIRHIRDLPSGGFPAIFALTSSDDPLDRERAQFAGADEYFVKPMNIAGLRGVAAQIAHLSGISIG